MSQGALGPDRRIGYAIKRLQQLLRVAMDSALTGSELSMAQFAVLKSLELGPLTAADLARRCFTTRQSMQDVLACLHARGYIHRAAPPGIGRRQPITLTSAGARAARTADHTVAAVETTMTHGLSAAEQGQLLGWLTRCADNLQPSEAQGPELPEQQ